MFYSLSKIYVYLLTKALEIVLMAHDSTAADDDVALSIPAILQQAKMRLWTMSDCMSSYYYATPLMLCAGYKSGYIANCLVSFQVFSHILLFVIDHEILCLVFQITFSTQESYKCLLIIEKLLT